MDQNEPEGEELSGHIEECCQNPALDRLMCLPGDLVSEVPVENRSSVTADFTNITAQFVRKARFARALSTKTKNKANTKQPVTAYLKL
jgi:hypothetical protein